MYSLLCRCRDYGDDQASCIAARPRSEELQKMVYLNLDPITSDHIETAADRFAANPVKVARPKKATSCPCSRPNLDRTFSTKNNRDTFAGKPHS
ncbi:hypothetical protein CMEL01_10513 [Colletotrichum melonis]|uniref:Uncharacterized protein n=3 Tax=Colletotrichum acutatum species complex TaxID=2707335 RepID=A0AAI9ZCV2_9PEZI|nr:uncharacterized protein CCOS01_01384 [Colletotrichum costaricense]KAK1446270.1 hypothetical protein CMEL01_10513 [Colletotrichum melonis]KAK1540070.1 hypothetical protein CCOS01_01384 [Colletotrichum costaricense]